MRFDRLLMMSLLQRGSGLFTSLKSRPGGRPPFEGVYVYLLALLAGYAIADLSVLSIRPSMLPSQALPAKPDQFRQGKVSALQDYDSILARNILNSDGKIPPALTKEGAEDGAQETEGPAQLSQLPLGLEGTIVHANPARSLATINNRTKSEIKTLSPGQELDRIIMITKVERRKVTFRNLNNNRLEYIEIPKDQKITFGAKAPQVGGGVEIQKRGEYDFVVSRTEINKYTSDLPSILQQARMVPNIVPGSGGKVDGFRFVTIQPGSIYEKLGFRPMDVIKGVNGEPVNSPTKAMELYNALKTENRIALVIERNGREEKFSYDVTE